MRTPTRKKKIYYCIEEFDDGTLQIGCDENCKEEWKDIHKGQVETGLEKSKRHKRFVELRA